MNSKETGEAGWSVGKSKTTPSSQGAWQIMKQWICYPLSVLVTLCWYSLRGSQGLNDKKKLQPGLALANMIYSCIEGTPLYKGKRRRGNNNWRDDVLCHLRHQSQVKHEACGKPLRGIKYIDNPCEIIIIISFKIDMDVRGCMNSTCVQLCFPSILCPF